LSTVRAARTRPAGRNHGRFGLASFLLNLPVMRIGPSLSMLILAGLPAAVRAETEARAMTDVSLAGNLGYGSPVGIAGGSLTYHGLEPLQLAVGIGASDDGPQISFAPRLVFGDGAFRPLVGAGPAVTRGSRSTVVWLSWEAGFEVRGDSGGFFSLAVGQRMLAAGTIVRGCALFCEPGGGTTEHGRGWHAATIRLTLGTRL
jgi:hypothetical protein